MTTPSTLARSEIESKAREFEWYHTIELAPGVITKGQYDHRALLPHYGIPGSLEGKTVLDIGPAHGFFAFEFEKRGAARVVTVDLPSWSEHDASPALKEVFARERLDDVNRKYLHDALGFAIQARSSKVERLFCNIYDVSAQTTGVFDVVFCASVLLHLTDPLRALYAMRTVTREMAIVATAIDTDRLSTKARALFMGTATGQAFWLPNMLCFERMALAAGFARVERVSMFHLKSVDGVFDTPHGVIRAYVE